MHPPAGLEWVVILVVVILLFGAKKIPDLAKGLGEGLKEFRKATQDKEDAKSADAAKPPEVDSKKKG